MKSMRAFGNTWLLTAAVIGGACTPAEDDEASRQAILSRTAAAIASDALSDSPTSDFLSAQGRISARVTQEQRAYAGSFALGAGRGSVLVKDVGLRQARAEAAVALDIVLDREREDDAASAQHSLDILLTQIKTIDPGATSCSALGIKADRCVTALLILEVQRSRPSAPALPVGESDAGQPTEAGASPTDAARPTGASEAGVAPGPDKLPTGSSGDGTCSASVDAPASLCASADPFEPNNQRKAARPVEIKNGCGILSARSDQSDDDVYSFTSERSDPVALRLGYTAVGNTDLKASVYDFNDAFVASAALTRSMPTEQEGVVFQTVANRSYTATIGGNATACQPYTLSLQTNYCTDAYEDNEDAASARELKFNEQGVVEIDATVHSLDDDNYFFNTPKGDPILVTGTYAVPSADGADLDIAAYTRTDSFLWSHQKARAGLEEVMRGWIDSQGPSGFIRLYVDASKGQCTPYKLKIEAAACTDAYEDNDNSSTLAPLTAGQDHKATIISKDDDHYDLTQFAGKPGSCTVTFSLPATSAQTIKVSAYTRTDSFIDSASTSAGTGDKTLTVSWTTEDIRRLIVDASSYDCQPYTLRCQAN